MATIKHLIGNEQEMWRMYNPFQAAYSANIGKFSLDSWRLGGFGLTSKR